MWHTDYKRGVLKGYVLHGGGLLSIYIDWLLARLLGAKHDKGMAACI